MFFDMCFLGTHHDVTFYTWSYFLQIIANTKHLVRFLEHQVLMFPGYPKGKPFW